MPNKSSLACRGALSSVHVASLATARGTETLFAYMAAKTPPGPRSGPRATARSAASSLENKASAKVLPRTLLQLPSSPRTKDCRDSGSAAALQNRAAPNGCQTPAVPRHPGAPDHGNSGAAPASCGPIPAGTRAARLVHGPRKRN